jgi:single-stranded DNA-binding protein
VLTVLASGTLARDPKPRTSAAGKTFATALLRCPAEDAEPMLLSLIAFNEPAVRALLALQQGDALAVAGRAKPSTWEKNGEQHHGLSVVAEHVLTAYHVDKRRRQVRGDDGAGNEQP